MNVALGVGGGIAAYKAAELARALMERGYTVQVLMTRAAEEFIRPLTFAALTGRKVITNLFSGASAEDTLASAIEHIRVAQENQILVIAPATAVKFAFTSAAFAGVPATNVFGIVTVSAGAPDDTLVAAIVSIAATTAASGKLGIWSFSLRSSQNCPRWSSPR